MQVTCTKKAPGAPKFAAAPAGAPLAGFNLQDNGDDTFTVVGTDAAGNPVDIAAVATLTATSDKPAVVTVDPPKGMTSAVHAAVPAPKPGDTATVTLVATWKDGSVGPFTVAWPLTITAGGPTGITVTPGVPTVR